MSALPGRVAVVTGGASGIGRALGEELAARGCVVVLADRQLELAREAAAAMGAEQLRREQARDRGPHPDPARRGQALRRPRSVLCPGVVRTPILTGGRCGRTKMVVDDARMLRLSEALHERVRRELGPR